MSTCCTTCIWAEIVDLDVGYRYGLCWKRMFLLCREAILSLLLLGFVMWRKDSWVGQMRKDRIGLLVERDSTYSYCVIYWQVFFWESSLLETYDSNLLYIFVDMLIAKKGSRADAGKYLITTVIHLSCGLTLAAAKVAPSFNPVFCAPFRPRNIITHISSLFPPCLSLVLDSLTPVLAGCNSSLSIPRYFIEYSLYACTLSFKFWSPLSKTWIVNPGKLNSRSCFNCGSNVWSGAKRPTVVIDDNLPLNGLSWEKFCQPPRGRGWNFSSQHSERSRVSICMQCVFWGNVDKERGARFWKSEWIVSSEVMM